MLPVVALDFGGTKLAVAAVAPDGRVLARAKAPVCHEGVAACARQAAEMAGAGLQQAGLTWPGIASAGACVPGIYYADRGEAWAPNLWGWDAVPLRDELSAVIPAPVTIDSDRSAYVLGEAWLGAARGLTDVVFLAIGTGIGAGILSGGRVIRGAQGIAGAVGWFALKPGRNELYRRTGCFESEAAGPVVARRYAERTGSTQSLAAEAVCAAARSGDADAITVLEETAVWLGMGIANLISTLNPQMVVLGGGLMHAGDLMIDTIRRTVLDWAQPLAARDARIELSRLGEDAGLMGAARLALDSVDPQS